jgi:hypothetical protein
MRFALRLHSTINVLLAKIDRNIEQRINEPWTLIIAALKEYKSMLGIRQQ